MGLEIVHVAAKTNPNGCTRAMYRKQTEQSIKQYRFFELMKSHFSQVEVDYKMKCSGFHMVVLEVEKWSEKEKKVSRRMLWTKNIWKSSKYEPNTNNSGDSGQLLWISSISQVRLPMFLVVEYSFHGYCLSNFQWFRELHQHRHHLNCSFSNNVIAETCILYSYYFPSDANKGTTLIFNLIFSIF